MIYFNKGTHTYYNEEGEIYDSPSTFLKRYKNEFDEDRTAIRYAEKHGETPEYWIERWRNIRDTSTERGSNIHETKEDMVYGRGVDKVGDTIYQVQNRELMTVKSLWDLPDGLYPELIVWDHQSKTCGTGDKIAIQTIDQDRWVDIEDYKTNKKLDKVSWFNPKYRTFKMMRGPVKHLMDCNWIHYTLQQSFYGYMMELAGFKIRSLALIHIPHPDPETGKQPPDRLYRIPYLRKEIQDILEDYNKGRKAKYIKRKTLQ